MGPNWDTIWMNLAKDLSKKSTCSQPNRQVGCVIVREDNESVLGIGYNGGAMGGDNFCVSVDKTDVGNSRCTCVHAEMNAVGKLNTTDPVRKKMYLTLSPCALCWKLIVNCRINEVIYLNAYLRDTSPLEKLVELGVKVRKYEDT